MADDKPTTAFILSLIGAILMLLSSGLMALAGTLLGGMMSFIGLGFIAAFFYVGLVCAIIALVGAIMMNSSNTGRVRTGAILVLVFSIINLFTGAGGFFIGFILGLIGGIMGLVWHPRQPMAAPPPPTPPA